MLQMKESLQLKFEEVTGLKLLEVQNSTYNYKLVTFDKFAVNDELNLKLLTCQGVTGEYVKMQSAKKTNDGQRVYLFIIKNNMVKSFYPCYVEKVSDTMPKIDTSIVSVIPLKADNTRQTAHNKAMTIANDMLKDTVTRSEFNAMNDKLDLLLASLVSSKTVQKNKTKK